MEFRVLGPLEARGARGEQLPVSAPMLRALLAALVLRAGRVVPVEELTRQLWGEDHPLSVPRTLRNYVMRLRKAVGEERILTTAGGYQLEADWHETDLGRFHDLLRRSRRNTVPPEEAAELLDQALALWRGTPLGGVGDCPLRTAELPRLEEMRLAAVEERFALRLGLGHHEALTEELVAAVRQHPLRERLVSHLMLALYRNRRTAEALAVYREARRTLVRELGIEPGRELRALERAILRGDRELETPTLPVSRVPVPAQRAPAPPAPSSADEGGAPTAPSPSDAGGAEPPPRFPAGQPTFVARSVESARLRELLTGAVAAPAVCLLDGPGGAGKSALAVRVAHEVADQFPDGLLHVDLRGADPHSPPLDHTQAVRALLPALGVARESVPGDQEAALALYHSALAGRRVLLLLDNAHDAAQVASLVPVHAGAACLVTSRSLLTGPSGAHHLHIDVLDGADAVELVRTVSGRRPGAGDEPGAWEELAALCGRLPLALDIIALRMASRPRWSLQDWIDTLRDERGRLDQLVVADRDVRASLLTGVGRLRDSADPVDREAAALFPFLGAAHVRCHSVSAVAALAGSEPDAVRAALERLADARVLASPRPGLYTLHDLVRAVASGEADRLPEPVTRAALARLAHWYAGALHRLNLPLRLTVRHTRRHREGAELFPYGPEFTTPHEALTWADDAVTDVLALARQLAAPAYDTVGAHGAVPERGAGDDAESGPGAGDDAGTGPGAGDAAGSGPGAGDGAGTGPEAGDDIGTGAGDELRRTHVGDEAGTRHVGHGPGPRAGHEPRTYVGGGRGSYAGRGGGSPFARGQLSSFALEALTALDGYLALRLDRSGRHTLCELAWSVAERCEDRHAMATVLARLGRAEALAGDSDEGVSRLRRGIGLFRAVGADEDAAVAMSDLVPCLVSQGEFAEAVRVGEAALTEAEREGLPDVASSVRSHLAGCHLHLGDRHRALRLLGENYERADTPALRASAAGALAELHLQAGEFTEAAHWARTGIGHSAELSGAYSDRLSGEAPASAVDPAVDPDPSTAAEQHIVLATALEALGRSEEAQAAESHALTLLDGLEARECAAPPGP
ncbi:AfsR/SARP family transcriptional regulator [Streptomyces iconiensis]|uniref:BTAD domain-containing putative transcriptional regulator n=1 Tax=Streptomyces iconiensis TaxID=1384038 RepID=A0ABT6ZVE3_9ACTN|nr:AfsR/SARP family transcriptional regulator [Streptomyces iconiensis]MDJ1133019.1 BTAD domain-containing putative transcriptional regulator [Streptomyces iconiensis]